MLKEEINYNLSIPKLMWVALIVLAFAFLIYRAVIVKTSEKVYSVATLVEHYNDSKTFGKVIKYHFDGKSYTQNCNSNECRNAKIGKRFLIHFYKDDPKFYNLYYEIIVPDSITVPILGWDEIPL